jgi:hypothetical protein
VLEREVKPIDWQDVRKLVGPFDCRDDVSLKVLLQADPLGFGFAPQSIEIHMNHREPALVFVDQDEGRAGHLVRRRAQACGNSTHESRFPGAEFSGKGQGFTAGQ